ncbi:MAG: hypothetical protein KAR42_00595 [candidate division Zixibacteria bacterium]|nr:hypothetical protein [candidate division Zixibacteria bacterium]
MTDDNQFSYEVSKEKLFIYWHHKQVMILKDKKAAEVSGKLKKASPEQAQMILAKLTGNFKRGNERLGGNR